MPFAPLPGCNLYYEVHGAGAETIVFAHGAGGSHLSWYQQVPYLSSRYRCVTFDHRNYGQTVDESGEGWSAYPRDLGGLLDHIGIERVLLVGQSMGGFSCFPFAVSHPERVRSLVMASTALGVDNGLADEIIANLVANVDLGRGGFTRDYQKSRQASYFLYEQLAGLNKAARPDPRPTPVTASDLAGFAVPTLFLGGAEDYLVTPDILRRAHLMVPGSRYEVVEGAGHSVYWEQPSIFNHVVDRFFSADTED